jgi:hypothetical protein
MTSRIQADGEGKESKWADIDDDEDDWAPETIEWGDGTKVTVNQADVIPPATQTSKPESTTTEEDKPAQPVKIVPPLTTTTIGPNATVLRVGASAERQQAQKAATLQKGPTEKPIQATSKAPAPPPSKSPWAALPPVDKVSPIAINPQLSMPQPTRYYNNQGSLQSPSTMASQSPAKEISADDFNRSWRDSQNSQPRELYMPNSGRYEAVNESRRRGSRNDQNFRAPAVLQRPSQSDQHTPAEPSAAFQTHRSSTEQDRAPWARRRASSNVSATSGQYGRRMSVTKLGDRDLSAVSSEGAQERRGSHATASDSVGSQDIPPPPVPTAAYRPQGFSNVQQMPRQPSFNADQAPANTPPPVAAADLEAERALQKQLMREKRELAIKRRQEEEARLEAEKKERIRLKLEAMGPPPEKSKQQETPIANQEARVSAPTSAPPTQTPPKPPIPEASGQPTQYGMMKLHPPDVTRAPASVEQHPEMVRPIPQPSDIAGPLSEPALNIPNPSSAITNGVRPSPEPQPTKMSRDAPLDDRVVQTSKASGMASESRSPWPSSRVDHRPPPTNLWGPPTNNKALGNGTFDQSLAGFPSREFGAREPPWKNGRLAAERSPQLIPATTHVPMDRTPSLPSFPPSEQSPLAANSEIDSVLPQSRPAPIGPPQAQQASQRWQASPNLGPVAATVAAWNNFSAAVAQDDRAENERAQHELAIRREEEARTGVRRAPQYTFNETWKQIETGDQAGQRQVIGVAQANFNPSMLTGTQFGAVGALPVTDLASRPVNSLRSSRFFPQPTDNTSGQNRRAVTYSHPEPSADSPPPPPAEEFGSPHPAYDGDFRHPIVQLPPKKPVVKLPPAPSSTPPPVSTVPDRPPVVAAPLSFAAAVKTQPAPQPSPPPPPPPQPQPQPSLRAVSTPIAATASWQDRFNGLFGRHPQPERTQPERTQLERKDQVLAVTSASKEPLDVLPINVSASVSLPQLEDDILKDAGKATSKDVEDEEEIFEDRVTGDLPTIKIPQALPAALPAARMPFVRPKPKILPQLVEPLSVMPLMVELLGGYPPNSKKGDFITIRLPGATEELLKELPRKGSSSSTSRSKTSRNISSSFSTKHKRGGTKSRDSSATHSQSSQGSKSGLTQQSQPNGSVPSPRPVQNQGQRFRGGRQATGVVH